MPTTDDGSGANPFASLLTAIGSGSDATAPAGAPSSIGKLLATPLSGATLTIETTISPPFTIRPSFNADGTPAPAQGGTLNPLVYLKPKITVRLANGQQLPPLMPYGEPGENYVPHLLGVVAAVAAGALLLGGLTKIAKYAAIGAGGLIVLGVVRNRLGK